MTWTTHGLVALAVVEAAGATTLGAAILRGLRGAPRSPERLRPLLLLLALLLGGLGIASLLLWLVMLQGQVTQWEGVRCVVGVLRIGTGSAGAPGWLPFLARATFVLKAVTILAAGAAVVLHLAGRDRPEGTLLPAHGAILAVLAAMALAGAAAGSAWVLIPKQSQLLASGCCGSVATAAGPELARGWTGGAATGLAAAFCVPGLALAGSLLPGIAGTIRAGVGGAAVRWVLALALAVAGALFLDRVIAPAALGLPLHRCVPCLVADAPETLVGIAALATPFLATSWSLVLAAAGTTAGAETRRLASALDRMALFGSLAAPLFLAVQWGAS